MNIPGYAHTEGWQAKRDANVQRYNEIAGTKGVRFLRKISSYGRTQFEGVLETPEALALGEMEIALIADHGNLCFGGMCSKDGQNFSGVYFTD